MIQNSNRNPNGIQPESNRNPTGIRMESEWSRPSRGRARGQAQTPARALSNSNSNSNSTNHSDRSLWSRVLDGLESTFLNYPNACGDLERRNQ